MDTKTMSEKIMEVEKNLALFAAGERSALEWRIKVDHALFGHNGDSGMVDDVRFMKKVFKIVAWIFAIAFTPIFGMLGFLMVKIMAHIDAILKLLYSLK